MSTTMNETSASPLVTTEIDATPMSQNSQPVVPAPTPQPVIGQPEPIVPAADPDIPHETPEEATGVGVEGEIDVWEGRYSLKNFIGRFLIWGAIGLAWVALAVFTWGYGHVNISFLTFVLGIAVGLIWLGLLYRVMAARWGHKYRLSNRRLFVGTGLMTRRRDQMELLRVQDVSTMQSLLQRWCSVGTVVVISSEKHLPVLYLSGVDDPKTVMDLVWHHARAERDRRSVKVDSI